MPGKRILSGVQSSGTLHIGNYFGMMRPSFALQEENSIVKAASGEFNGTTVTAD